MEAIWAWGNGQRPTDMCRQCPGSTSSPKRPSPRSRRSSSLRSTLDPIVPVRTSGRVASKTSAIDHLAVVQVVQVALDGVDDVHVAGATADDARQLLAELLAGRA